VAGPAHDDLLAVGDLSADGALVLLVVVGHGGGDGGERKEHGGGSAEREHGGGERRAAEEQTKSGISISSEFLTQLKNKKSILNPFLTLKKAQSSLGIIARVLSIC
jgi:hypothetical protein